MGYSELVGALKQKEKAEIESIWNAASDEAKKIEKETAIHLDEIRRQVDRGDVLKAKNIQKSILAEAHQKAAGLRSSARHKLAVDIKKGGLDILPSLRENNYGSLFITLVEELPAVAWEEVRVNPSDELLAKRFFSDEVIVYDSTIIGGLEVSGNKGRLHIVNTLTKRLERGWFIILPSILSELMARVT